MIGPQHIEALPGPRYRAIADALADQIATGGEAGERKLPTHRALARRLGVTVNTVTRAYAELGRRGLIAGQVGRGTFVNPIRQPAPPLEAQPAATDRRAYPAADAAVVDLARIRPPLGQTGALAQVLRGIADEFDGGETVDLHEPSHRSRSRSAVNSWLREIFDLAVADDAIALTAGGRGGAVHAALAATTKPGDTVLCEPVTFPGLRALAGQLGLQIAAVEADDEGMLPDALEIACWRAAPRALYLTPTFHDATGTTMPEPRRRRIARIAATNGVTIVEDAFLGVLARDAPPLFIQFAAPVTVFLTGVSPTICDGIETGIIVASPARAASIARSGAYGVPNGRSIDAEVLMRALEIGVMAALLDASRTELAARQALARASLGMEPAGSGMTAPHLWLALPPPWRASEFAAQMRAAAVAVEPAENFVPDRSAAPHAVRIALGGAHDRAALRSALRTVAARLQSQPWRGGLATTK